MIPTIPAIRDIDSDAWGRTVKALAPLAPLRVLCAGLAKSALLPFPTAARIAPGGLLDVANQNAKHPVPLEFQVNNKDF